MKKWSGGAACNTQRPQKRPPTEYAFLRLRKTQTEEGGARTAKPPQPGAYEEGTRCDYPAMAVSRGGLHHKTVRRAQP